jgi:hypothetical protein
MSAAAKDAMRAQMGAFKKAAACLMLMRAPRPPRVFFFLRPPRLPKRVVFFCAPAAIPDLGACMRAQTP